MRIALLALPLLVVAAPAAAQSRRPTAEQAAAALNNPLTQEVGARALAQLAGIVLDTRVGPAASLLRDPDAPPVRYDARLRDLVEPDAEARVYRDSRRAIGTAGAVAAGSVAQARELQRTADRLEAALGPLIDALSAGER